jgi:hypothetical protein
MSSVVGAFVASDVLLMQSPVPFLLARRTDHDSGKFFTTPTSKLLLVLGRRSSSISTIQLRLHDANTMHVLLSHKIN